MWSQKWSQLVANSNKQINGNQICPKTNLAVSSNEFCQCEFDESQIGIADLANALHTLQLSKVEHGVMIDSEIY